MVCVWSGPARSLVAAGARPRFSQIELDPPCGAPNWDKGGWNNKAEPLDCPLTNGISQGKTRQFRAGWFASVKGQATGQGWR